MFRLKFQIIVVACVLGGLGAQAFSAELDLLSVSAEKKSSNYGPYVGIFGGASTGQNATVSIPRGGQNLDYDFQDRDGDFLAGFEVGYSWRTKYFAEFSLEFEGMFSSSEVNAVLSNGNNGTPLNLNDPTTIHADMNYAAFLLNAAVTLDLKKLKPRIGPYLSRLRPYVGAGVGGAQVWFQNQETRTVGDLLAIPTGPSVTPFAIDEFVFAYQIFGGLEVQLTEKFSAYGEYRQINLDKVGELNDFSSEYLLGGLRIRY